MNEAKHTPGPRGVYVGGGAYLPPSLIKAAPDLLAAAKDLLDAGIHTEGEGSVWIGRADLACWNAAAAKARAAIALAEGGAA